MPINSRTPSKALVKALHQPKTGPGWRTPAVSVAPA
jgi:hypothetical protein